MNARLGDFGLAKLYDQGFDPQTSRVAGNLGRLIEPRGATNKVVIVEWTLECWKNGDILEASNERLRQEHNREQLELVLILGVLCSHQVPGVRPDMLKVVQILNGNLQLPDNLLDIVKAEKVRMWSETSERVVDVLTSQCFVRTLAFAEPFRIPDASADQYLGIFNKANNGNISNHIIAVELDIHKDEEFGDVDDNHVGININGMRSIDSHPAGYYDQDGQFRNISLISGKLLRVTILYSQDKKQLNVTLSSPEEAYHPDRPLLSLNRDLSPFVLEKMYVGFSASTGMVGAMHYLWSRFFTYDLNVHELDFPIPTFPPYPNPKSQVKRTVMVTFLTILLFIALVASALSIFFYKKHKMVKEVLEEWEIQCGPHRFSYKELFKATKGFSDKQLLGKGGFGQVFKGTLPGSDTEIAVKRISHDSRQGMQEFLAEISTIGRLRHQNLVRLQGYCRYKEQLYLVYDFMPNGSLDKYLYRRGNQEPLTWNQRFKIIKDVAYALCYLHHEWGQVVIHRDIKPANVLIDHHMDARLGDFGLAKLYDQGFDPHTSRVIGTIGYIAPELIRSGRATTGTDVYVFGLFMLEVSCGRRLIEPRAPSNEAVLAEWTLECWESGDILEAASERLHAEQDREQVELVMKLGVLCSHQVATIRRDMSKVIKILNCDVQIPDNLLDIVKAEKIRVWSEISERALGVLNTQMSIGTLTLTEPFTSHGR
ncbi:BnaC03g24410D [Brassica napus]|uniref:non-specific serine/threonine protein kinase n=2 Tax=Brassica napus TaxID=3708 RepID=A0A078I3W4_BRANA|nr:BnaC03g24410D [Brassica napus]